jgi:uncharacterized membrane protein
MSNWDFLLTLHATSGGLALLVGGIAAYAKKGQRLHRLCGNIFIYSMLFSAASALIMSQIKPNPFLFGIGLFTVYLILSGWIPVWKTKLARKKRYIKVAGIFGIFSALFMAYQAYSDSFRGAAIILIVFGGILLAFSVSDLLLKFRPANSITRHGGRMGGAYIATFTAFLVVNNSFLPPLIAWLMPTAIGSLLIFLSLRKWNKSKLPTG